MDYREDELITSVYKREGPAKMEPKTFVALTDEQLVVLSWAMDHYYTSTKSILEGSDYRVRDLRDKMRKHAAPAWDRMTQDYEA